MYSELEVQAKLSHDNVVRFFELFDEPDGFYVVMELLAPMRPFIDSLASLEANCSIVS